MSLPSFLVQIPVWVWPLLVLLLVLGWRASRTRHAPTLIAYLLPALGLISVTSLARLPQPLLVFAAHGLGYAIGAVAGFAVQKRWILGKSGCTVHLAGEWLTLAVMMTLFCAQFVNGIVAAVAPQWHTSAAFLMAFAALTGMASGTFGGRAVRLATTAASA